MRNLNALFNTSSQPVEVTASQAEHTATLYKRPTSSKWQIQFKLPSGNWHAASTGTATLTDAKSVGIEVQQRVLAQLTAGESISQKTFGEVAVEELAAMRRALDNSRAPKTYRDYIFAINKYLIPFFGKLPVASIRDDTIEDFSAWREVKMGREPKASTMRNHASGSRYSWQRAKSMDSRLLSSDSDQLKIEIRDCESKWRCPSAFALSGLSPRTVRCAYRSAMGAGRLS